MPIAPTDLIAFAKAQIGAGETELRAAASRAYYAAFHSCKPLADKLPDPPNPKGMHDRAVRAMAEYPVTAANRPKAMAIRKLGIVMKQCRSLRTLADYKLVDPFTQHEAQEAIQFAEDAIRQAASITFP